MIKEDLRARHCHLVQKAIESSQSLNKIRNDLAIGDRHLLQLKVAFTPSLSLEEESCPSFLESEIESAIQFNSLKTGKTPGRDGITTEMLKWAIKVGETTVPIEIHQGVRQRDPLSPKLFTVTLENVFPRLNWNSYGLRVNGSQLTNLRFADDVVLIAKSGVELRKCYQNLTKNRLNVD
ncbi:hypothetical protein OESDEN_00800 [Oesophagostomum dentatum]|uniref:Reverse transcriptase domain-containing protein n=1 Tax=Oesophagostomum dentatum TaxID=61180 RepID=A0A0B1TNW1_OESDE|nr:hypothetical protein OESDEN_00800 [Oesophagostomum dentatum]